jgi:hypothetical protein
MAGQRTQPPGSGSRWWNCSAPIVRGKVRSGAGWPTPASGVSHAGLEARWVELLSQDTGATLRDSATVHATITTCRQESTSSE